MAGGYNVTVRDPDQAQREACLTYVKENARTYPATKLSLHEPGQITVHESLADAVMDAWLVIEAVPEKLALKIDTFAELERLAPIDAILATNSSSYKSSEMLDKVQAVETKARILNTHYYMPPQVNIVELMTDGMTDPKIIDFMVDRQKEAGTTPYVARKESTGLIFNRLWAAIKRETLTILAEGVSTPQEIDGMFKTMYGAPVGPCQGMDAVGLDTVAFIEGHYVAERGLPQDKTVDWLKANYIDKGKLGTKSEKGGLYPRVPRLLALDLGFAATKLSMAPGSILEISGDGKTQKVLIKGQALPDGIDVDKESGRMFWTNMGMPGKPDGAIMSANLEDGSDVKTVISAGTTVNTPKQLVVESVAKKLYFCDREGMRVMRCNYDGSDVETLISNGNWETDGFADKTKWCVGIAVSHKHGKFYWTQKGASKAGEGRIFCANIEMPAGATVETRQDIELLLDQLPEPIDLEVDEGNDLLYWSDRGELPFGNSVNRVGLDASGLVVRGEGLLPYEVLVRHLNEAIGLKLDLEAGHMYLTDIGGSLYRCNLDGTDKKNIFSSEDMAFAGITIV